MSSNTSDMRTLFVTKLHPRVTARELRSVFEKYGRIKRTEVIACPLHKYDRGSVEFQHEADAQDALKDFDSKYHKGECNWYVTDDSRHIDHVEDCYTRSVTEEKEEVENPKPSEAVEEDDRSPDSSLVEQLAPRSSSDSEATNHTTVTAFPNHVEVPQEFKHLTFGTVRDVFSF